MNARIQKSSVKLKLSSTLKPQTHWLKRKQKKNENESVHSEERTSKFTRMFHKSALF